MWTGVQASFFMEIGGREKEPATWIVAEGAEGAHHSKSIPMWKVMDDALIVYGQNGEALRPEQGYPLRILLPGFEAINSIKYLRRIKVVDTPYLQERETSGYQTVMNAGKYADGKARWFQFEMGPKSVIIRPSGTMQIANAGYYEITGLAWSGAGAVKRVEISTDNGKTWKDAELQGPVLPKAHTRFTLPWEVGGAGERYFYPAQPMIADRFSHRSKRWPGFGVLRPVISRSPKWVTQMRFNPWRVAADGKVYNALFA